MGGGEVASFFYECSLLWMLAPFYGCWCRISVTGLVGVRLPGVDVPPSAERVLNL